MSNEQKIMPVQYIQTITPSIEEDEIDLRELFKTIFKHKKFIIIFTSIVTILAIVYALEKTPIYEVKSYIQFGYIYSNSNSKRYLLDPQASEVYVKNIYNPKDSENSLLQVKMSKDKKTKDIYLLNIEYTSNNKAVNLLNKIINDLKSKENKKLTLIKQNLNQKLIILKDSNKQLGNQLLIFNKKLNKTKDAKLYAVISNNILKIQVQLTNNKMEINNIKSTLSPSNIVSTHIIGNIIKSKYPIKPKKRLIVVVAFLTGLILSIFLVFFIEFIREDKEEKE